MHERLIREQPEKGDEASQLGLPWMGLEVSARSWHPSRSHISASTNPCELKILTLEILGVSWDITWVCPLGHLPLRDLSQAVPPSLLPGL